MIIKRWEQRPTSPLLGLAMISLVCVLSISSGCAMPGSDQGLLATLFGYGYENRAESGPKHDRPFPLGQVTDAHWETQKTNAEAADFIFYDHEFVGDTAELAPAAKDHLEQVALRLEHVPFPVVIERSPHNAKPQLDEARLVTIVEQVARLGVNARGRTVIATSMAEGLTAIEGENAYFRTLYNNFSQGGGFGRRFGGSGGFFR